jgi:YHS domain-containing protein/uncharacterized membrane protein YraQ (UPF0718 family)
VIVVTTIWDGLKNAVLMAYAVWWALVFGFTISAIVQAWVPRHSVERAMGGGGAGSLARATGLGAASSSCSYAAIAIAKSLFQKGASGVSALAFQFASTNLVWELGLVLWTLIGWQFAVGEFVGGIVMIVLMAAMYRLFVSPRLEARARRHAQAADTGHQHHSAESAGMTWRQRVRSVDAWSDVAHNFRGDVQMLYKEIGIGFLLAGFIGLLGNGFFHALFLESAPTPIRVVENVLIGPVIAVASFVCSVGNVPLAAVLWSGGLSFAGVMSFIFADLIVLPILLIYRKYYGRRFTIRITALMYITMVLAGLAVAGLFELLGLIPAARPTRADLFGQVQLDYKLALNVLGTIVFVALFALTMRRGATDPVCGMTVDRGKALLAERDGTTYYFCSETCRQTFLTGEGRVAHHASHDHPESATGAVDPVCEMTVDPATAWSAEVAGETYYFCAEYCRDLFVSRPEAFGVAGPDHPGSGGTSPGPS